MWTKPRPPSYKIGTSSRAQDEKDRVSNPGPGAYKNFDGTGPDKLRAPAVRFGTDQRRPQSASNQTPGAGSCILLSLTHQFQFIQKRQREARFRRSILLNESQNGCSEARSHARTRSSLLFFFSMVSSWFAQ